MTLADATRAAPRDALMQSLRDGRSFDIAVIGGGATGLGVALDAAARGYSGLKSSLLAPQMARRACSGAAEHWMYCPMSGPMGSRAP